MEMLDEDSDYSLRTNSSEKERAYWDMKVHAHAYHKYRDEDHKKLDFKRNSPKWLDKAGREAKDAYI